MKMIPLSQGKVALVSDKDYKRVCALKWHAFVGHCTNGRLTWYAKHTIAHGNGKFSCISMHKFICGHVSENIDHKNGDGLDNRRSNLRPCTITMNQANSRKRDATTSRFKGVYFHTQSQRWRAQVNQNYRSYGLGNFHTEIDAARAYDKKATRLFGKFALLNFPEKGSSCVSA